LTTRSSTRQVLAGSVPIGGGASVSVQSMTNTDTRDVEATVAQIKRLQQAGCELVRVAVPDAEAADALSMISRAAEVPLVADIHFDYRLALASIRAGVDKLRINPGNIGSSARVREVASAARDRGIPIRIGVNMGSLPRELVERHGRTARAMMEAALGFGCASHGGGLPYVIHSNRLPSTCGGDRGRASSQRSREIGSGDRDHSRRRNWRYYQGEPDRRSCFRGLCRPRNPGCTRAQVVWAYHSVLPDVRQAAR